MSWLKEVEGILARQKAEQVAQERVKQAKERERIERWKIFVDQTLGRLLTRWDNLEIDGILKDVRDLVWPGLEIDQAIVVPTKDKETLRLSRATVELDEEGRDLFGRYIRTTKTEGWSGYSRQKGLVVKGRKLTDVKGVMIDSGYSVEDVENPYFEGVISRSWSWTERDYEDEVVRYGSETKFKILLFEREAEVIIGQGDSSKTFQLDEILNTGTIRGEIARILKGEVGKT